MRRPALPAVRTAPGFTLIEVIVAIALFSFLVLAFLQLFGGFNRILAWQKAVTYANNGSSRVLNAAEGILLQSNQILSSQTISGTVYNSGANTLVLEMPSIDSNGNVIANTYDYAVIYLTGNNCYEIIQPNAGSSRPSLNKLISDSVNTLGFTYDNGTYSSVQKVTVDIVTQATGGGETVQAHLNEQIRLRNK